MFRHDVKMRSEAKPKPKNTVVKKTPISLVRADDTVKVSAYEINIDAASGIFPTVDNCFLCIGKDGIIRKVDCESGKIVAESERILSLVRSSLVPMATSCGLNLLSLPNHRTLLYGTALATTILFDSKNLKQLKTINQSFQAVHVLSSNIVIAKDINKDQAELIRFDETYKSLGKISFKANQEWTTLKSLLIKVKGNTLVFKGFVGTEFVETAKLKIDGFGFLKSCFIHKLQVYPKENLISFVMSTSSLDQQKAVLIDVANIYEPRILREFKQVYAMHKLPGSPTYLLQQLGGDTTHGVDLGDQSLVWDGLRGEQHLIPHIDFRGKMLARSPITGGLAYTTKAADKIIFIDSVSLKPQLKATEEKKQTPLISLSILKETPKPEPEIESTFEYSDASSFEYI